jgi:chemotaxis protein MotB
VQDRGYFDVVGRSSMQPEATSFEQITLAVRAKMQRTTDENPDLKDLAKNVRVSVTEDGLLITIIDGGKDLMFDSSSSELRPRLVALLELLAPIVGQLDNQIQVHGHTDGRSFPKGSNRSNWTLSFERADNARAVLERSGLRKGQVAGVFAHGDSALINTKEPFAPENRRLAILAVRRGLEKVAARGTKQTKPVEIEGDPLPPKAAKSDAPEPNF